MITIILLLLSFYLYSHWIWRPISPDERNYLAWGMKIYREGAYETLRGVPVTKVPPLHSFLLAWGFHLFGPSVDTAQSMSLLFGCLCVGLAYWFGKSLWNWRVGLMAALLLLTSAKGEFWKYSNRVLNEIHLSFFVFSSLFWLCLYWRYGRWWMGAGLGICLGLGLLTKEFTILLIPLVILVIVLRKGPVWRRLTVLTGVFLIVFAILLPWLVHVQGVTGSPMGGVLQRGQGRAAEVVSSKFSWGLRPVSELVRMVRFFDKPAWFSQVLYIAALLYGIWRFGRYGAIEEIILVGAALSWFSFFAVFKALPLDLRRLIPLLPIFAVLTAILFDAGWEQRAKVASPLGQRRGIVSVVLPILFVAVLINSLKPFRVLKGFQPLSALSSPREPFLQEEALEAIGCIPEGSRVMTNYESLLYFYSKGRITPVGIGTTTAKRKANVVKDAVSKGRYRRELVLIYDYTYRGKRIVMDEGSLLRQLEESRSQFLLFFLTGHRLWAPSQLDAYFRENPEEFPLVCTGDGYRLYELQTFARGDSNP